MFNIWGIWKCEKGCSSYPTIFFRILFLKQGHNGGLFFLVIEELFDKFGCCDEVIRSRESFYRIQIPPHGLINVGEG